MNAPLKKPEAVVGAGTFVPDADDAAENGWQKGQRRELPKVASLPFRWPKTFKEQRDYFETWHALAMRVIAENRASFRTMAVLWRFINNDSGTMWPTDPTLAFVTGSSEKSVSRDIGQYETLGILRVKHGSRKNRSGKLVKTRTLIPSVPVDLKGTIDLPVIEDHTDHSGLDDAQPEADNHTVHSGPNHTDHCGPVTLEEPMKRSGGDAA
ncbi:hypothetical protein [Mesorhizobium sp. A623]